jgi:hypothetical protein
MVMLHVSDMALHVAKTLRMKADEIGSDVDKELFYFLHGEATDLELSAERYKKDETKNI